MAKLYDLNKDLIVNVTPTGIEVALLEDNFLVELHQEKYNNQLTVGDIFLGRVKKIVSGLNAAFVDIDFEKDAFLHYTDLGPQVRSFKKYVQLGTNKLLHKHTLEDFEVEPDIVKTGNIEEVLTKRDLLLVQILKEPISTKGPRLSCEITLAGRYIVLAPFSQAIAISRKIKQEEERERLQKLVESIKPINFGVIVRTAAENKSVAEIHEDINHQLGRWNQILSEVKKVSPPAKVLSEISKSSSILRDLLNESFHRIVVSDKKVTEEIKEFIKTIAPDKVDIVSTHKGKSPIYDHFDVTKQIKASFGKTVNMKSGAYLVLEPTEAMHVIDVNSGHKMSMSQDQETSAITVNLEAANEIARQLRLRDLGGIIIIDFIDLKTADNKKMLFRRMKEAMQFDRAKHTILPLSKFGTMQITRQRTRPEIKISTSEVCPTCRGTGQTRPTILIIDELENNLSYLLNELDYKNLKIVVHPFIEAFIKRGIISRQWKWFWKHKKWVSVSRNENYYLTEFHFFDAKNEEIKM